LSNSNEYMKVYILKRYRMRMAKAKEILGGRCVICGKTDDLQIDHVDWITKNIQLNKL
jgi:hypothetical protein